jgi:TrmH family RNA methyltransferase
MFPPERLHKLSPAHRIRKVALMLTELERGLLADPGAASGSGGKRAIDVARATDAARILAGFDETPPGVMLAARSLLAASDVDRLRAIDCLRHECYREGGQAPADWDLLDPDSGRVLGERQPLQGLRVWLEDIRSPFNIGSMLRTAEAFGFEEVLLSPGCADPGHPRAARSAMGADRLVPWRRADALCLDEYGPAFALELGGTALDLFDFPERGIVVLGSEELGVSRSALSRCGLGKVSIPMRGAKASINVGVAFGVLAAAWSERVG